MWGIKLSRVLMSDELTNYANKTTSNIHSDSAAFVSVLVVEYDFFVLVFRPMAAVESTQVFRQHVG